MQRSAKVKHDHGSFSSIFTEVNGVSIDATHCRHNKMDVNRFISYFYWHLSCFMIQLSNLITYRSLLITYHTNLTVAYVLIGSPWLKYVQLSHLNKYHSAPFTAACSQPPVIRSCGSYNATWRCIVATCSIPLPKAVKNKKWIIKLWTSFGLIGTSSARSN